MFRLQANITLFVLIGSFIPSAHAADEQACFGRIVSELVSVNNEWRAQLFGSRMGRDGKPAALTSGEVDEERTGIFETKHRLTSELIEPIVESYRVYRCQALSPCEIAAKSFETDGGTFDLHILGCAPRTVERYSECFFAGENATASLQSAATNTTRNCQQLTTETLASERAVLRLAVAYDSGYRALLQLAGMIDWMLQGFPTETVKAISNMVNMLGKLHQIPCFIGQCDNPNSNTLTP